MRDPLSGRNNVTPQLRPPAALRDRHKRPQIPCVHALCHVPLIPATTSRVEAFDQTSTHYPSQPVWPAYCSSACRAQNTFTHSLPHAAINTGISPRLQTNSAAFSNLSTFSTKLCVFAHTWWPAEQPIIQSIRRSITRSEDARYVLYSHDDSISSRRLHLYIKSATSARQLPPDLADQVLDIGDQVSGISSPSAASFDQFQCAQNIERLNSSLRRLPLRSILTAASIPFARSHRTRNLAAIHDYYSPSKLPQEQAREIDDHTWESNQG
ncbi:hypothetical protein AYO21_09131 [Fonsecaea monophora]|uniref:Uncharacterized protein n=1 Tax=Fonsecaea monophora TaxID=254056 RepID=A0A177EYI4_9EURO|nr:hypothetical protein AYO21_09131 [Fonsecaea monophora]OAG36656.1 hypothetical protein AYO21_09131 [Fonsecaea monophora]